MKMKLLTIILKREVFYGTGLLLAGLILGWLLFAGGSNFYIIVEDLLSIVSFWN